MTSIPFLFGLQHHLTLFTDPWPKVTWIPFRGVDPELKGSWIPFWNWTSRWWCLFLINSILELNHNFSSQNNDFGSIWGQNDTRLPIYVPRPPWLWFFSFIYIVFFRPSVPIGIGLLTYTLFRNTFHHGLEPKPVWESTAIKSYTEFHSGIEPGGGDVYFG